MTPRLLIVEPSYRGHHLEYVGLLVQVARSRGWDVILATSTEARGSAEWSNARLERYEDLAAVVVDFGAEGNPATVSSLVSDLKPDAVIIPNADLFLARVATRPWRRFAVPHVGLVMRDPAGVRARGPRERLALHAKRLALRTCDAIPNVVVLRLGPAGNDDSRRSDQIPDPLLLNVGECDPESDLPSWGQGRYWFALVGVINHWKNPVLAVEGLIRSGLHDSAALALVGPVDESVLQPLIDALGVLEGQMPVRVVNRPLTNDEFNQVVAGTDAVIMTYSTHAPNSTAAKAAALGTRIVAAGSPSFLKGVLSVAPGAVTANLDADAVARALRRAIQMERPAPEAGFSQASAFGERIISEAERLLDRDQK